MKFQLTLLLISMLFSEVLSLMCQQCISLGIIPCTSTQINCSNQCASATVSVYTSVTKVINVSMQTCSMPDMCVNGSLNTGTVNLINSAKCCSTDLCNNETLPALPQQSPNGMMCYTCDPKGCSRALSCVGDQNFCISMSVQQGDSTVSMKGCASKSICDTVRPSSQGFAVVSVQCCEGNLCNSAESFTLSFLLTLVHLLSSILFY
ncbi:phospholipase A2 inhibitor and Ly6/PLAUR domain-containing protein-like [Pangasianodon hypophthalmus]|uniref:phospholipase A2 inhibitor and Ly6/PLAUR domain-containing protein-like n=1 Tax=Pangasianodon hypophthalmus TaxID=310915 RepID=UPI00230802BE|nr:phospholipase A2 inhibitor and Ly6/PLAUR domain-containing protein-like [Pangasianodon hypophthalmus]